ncbi:hypothetical protein ABZ782_28330 [Streptomyces asoensis]|uniref:DUF6907 domain-containing protein n=1 Tax=Streptomyces asoensis TaxID=249586 RepID=UPI0033F289E8
MHNSIAQTSTATSRLPEQSVTASLTVETMDDADTGGSILLASTQENQGDLQVVTVDQVLAKTAEQRAQLHRIEDLARQWGAAQTSTPDVAADGNLDRLAEALPAVVDRAMRETIPQKYTPELAQQMADDIMARLRRARAPRPLTAAERGASWMARWGCTPWCSIDHAETNAPEWHATAPVETDLRDHDLDTSGFDNNLPWMAARMVVASDKPQAYGRKTGVWIDYGVHTAELTPARARRALAALRGFAAELEAVVDQAEVVAADDFEGDPEIAAADKAYWDQHIRKINEAQA